MVRPLPARSVWLFGLLVGSILAAGPLVRAAEGDKPEEPAKPVEKKSDTVAAEAGGSSGGSGGGSGGTSSAPKPKYPPFSEVLKDFEPVSGLIKLYRKEQQLMAEIPPQLLQRDLIVLISIARGIGEGQLLGGMTWGFGDDWIWQFRKVDDNIQIVRRNVRFRAAKGSPEEKAVRLAYTDSVLYALPIVTQGPSGGFVIDLTPVFFSDLPQISQTLPGFAFSPQKSTWAEVKGFPDNVELQVAATYQSGGMASLDTVPDSRGATIHVHYSISMLPETGYQPRLADDRVGYFLTAVKDYSRKGTEDRFVRYINRWDLQKADPSAEISPPKKPIVFWIERTVPFKYRKAISDGILEWNKAYEKAGFYNAIEVRQQPDNADWDPEDINYNTFRWITASAGFAMGPSRVNPTTGQILDADIIFDADFVQFWKQEYETFTKESILGLTGGPLDAWLDPSRRAELVSERCRPECRCELRHGMSREFALAEMAILAAGAGVDRGKELEKLTLQGLKEVAMHEVGHTLGLRHNFKSSTFLSMSDLSDTDKTGRYGITASVMDYNPTNIAPPGGKQGDYFSTTIGPYDYWAIEYGYKPLSGGTDGEVAELEKIASRGAEPGHDYATDEDTRGIDSDPLANRFDLGKDPVEFAEFRTKQVDALIPGLVERAVEKGEGYQRARQAFGVLLGNRGMATFMAARMIGGLYVHRDHRDDPNGRPPYVVVPAARQRAALDLISREVFSDEPFNFPPELYNHLAATRWSHWGIESPSRGDIPVHEVILGWQTRVLDQLLSPLTLTRLYDSELKVPANEDAFTVAELLERLTKSIFSELEKPPAGEFTVRKPAISSLRRGLQREYIERLASMRLGSSGVPEDGESLAYLQLTRLNDRLVALLKKPPKLDEYSLAHLVDTQRRIQKVLDADLTLPRP